METTRRLSWVIIGSVIAVATLSTVAFAASAPGMWAMGGGMMGAGTMGGTGQMMTPEQCQATMGSGAMGAGQCPHHGGTTMDPAQCQSMMG